MTVEEFLTLCELQGWHFTASWVRKRLRQLDSNGVNKIRDQHTPAEEIGSSAYNAGSTKP